jgi:hypothetical protein
LDIKPKKFLVVPRDAYERLLDRYAELDDAVDRAKERAGEEEQSFFVIEAKAVVTREAPPVKVKRL